MVPAMRVAPVLAALLVTSAAGCGKKSPDGLPPASDWNANAAVAPTAPSSPVAPASPHGGSPHGGDPHAGMNMGGAGDPHAGLNMGGMGGMGGGGDPHAGMNMGGGGGPDVTQMGLASPDPNRPIDPSRRIKGVLKVDPKAKDRVQANGAIFLIVKRAGPDGQPTGAPLAVDKVTWVKDSLAFELTERHAMVAGTELTGDVIVSARYDQDSDAISKQPGDVTGATRVKVPADGVVLVLDTVLP